MSQLKKLQLWELFRQPVCAFSVNAAHRLRRFRTKPGQQRLLRGDGYSPADGGRGGVDVT